MKASEHMLKDDPGLFITLEGVEGCGKSTQARCLADRLQSFSIPLVLTLEPGGTQVGKDIRRILLDFRNQNLSPLAELFLYEADRSQHVKEVISPALEQGKWVLCDRFYDATVVYQGFARQQDMDLIGVLNKRASFGIVPDITFLIDCPVEVGIQRAMKREAARPVSLEEGQDRFEREDRDFHEAVRKGYLSLAKQDDERFVVVDGTLSVEQIQENIFENIRPYLSERRE